MSAWPARNEPHDVAIVGAGPAGSALARRLAQRGRRVVLIEASRFETPRIGETLGPEVQPEFTALGLWPEVLALQPLASWGTCSVWGEATARSSSHLHSPWGCGWHVDRAALDRLLARGAAAAGAALLEGRAVRSVDHDGHAWCLHTDSDAPAMRARVLVDATGRRAHLARRLGAQCLQFDSLVGIAVTCTAAEAAQQHHLLVEAVPEGWWYSAPMPGDAAASMITMLMTDVDGCTHERLQRADAWRDALRRSAATRDRIDTVSSVAPKVHLAHSQRLRRPMQPAPGPWLAIGDAALAIDPLSGNGVVRALRQAAEAVDTIEQMLIPDCAAEAISAFESARDHECSRYLFERAVQYANEQRFTTPFWQRRRHAAEAAGAAMQLQ